MIRHSKITPNEPTAVMSTIEEDNNILKEIQMIREENAQIKTLLLNLIKANDTKSRKTKNSSRNVADE